MQQIPKPRKLADLRACFIAPPGYKLVSSDLSNAEMRILADLSEDETLLEIFATGKDMHTTVARQMFRLSEEQDPKTMFIRDGVSYRFAAKTIGFGLVYGMGVTKLGATLGVDLETAKGLMESFFANFPKVHTFLSRQAVNAVRRKYSETVLGRRRTYQIGPQPQVERDSIEAQEWNKRLSEIKRLGKNTPIQGSCADIVKLSMLRLATAIRDNELDATIVNVIHDEIIVETNVLLLEEVAEAMKQSMVSSFSELHPKVYFPEPDVKFSDHWEHD